jgi:hypothetical protein
VTGLNYELVMGRARGMDSKKMSSKSSLGLDWEEVESQVMSKGVLSQNIKKVQMLLDLDQFNRAMLLFFDIKRSQLHNFTGFIQKSAYKDFEKFKKIIDSIKTFFIKCIEESKDLFDDYMLIEEHKLEFSEFFRESMKNIIKKFTQNLSEEEERDFYNEIEYMLEGFNAKGLSFDHLFETRIKQINS